MFEEKKSRIISSSFSHGFIIVAPFLQVQIIKMHQIWDSGMEEWEEGRRHEDIESMDADWKQLFHQNDGTTQPTTHMQFFFSFFFFTASRGRKMAIFCCLCYELGRRTRPVLQQKTKGTPASSDTHVDEQRWSRSDGEERCCHGNLTGRHLFTFSNFGPIV